MKELKPPFQYYGGKRRAATDIWERLGNPDVYIEPFAGSLACLLAKPKPIAKREVVVDLSGHIVNFWRAVKYAPEEVVKYADWPNFHHDLSARHKYLVQWGEENREKLITYPEFFCSKAAGWWRWGISRWVSGAWGDNDRICGTISSRPMIRKIKGLDAESIDNLCERLKDVHVLGGNWRQATTKEALNFNKSPNGLIAAFLDPPYKRQKRKKMLYENESQSDDVAVDSYEWALEHGDKYRIAYCCHGGDFCIPEGWDSLLYKFDGHRHESKKHHRDLIMFSPACLEGNQCKFDF